MMQAFRNAAKPVVVILTVTFIAWLVVDLSGLTGNSGLLTRTDVGSINGQKIDSRLYQQAVSDETSRRQQQAGRSLGIEEVEQVRNEVWEGMVQQAILSAEIKKRGLTVSPDEIAAMIEMVPLPDFQADPNLQTDGVFDINKYRNWLASPAGAPVIPYLEAQYASEILRTKLLRNVTADVFISDAALWQRYRDQNERTTIALTPLVANRVIPDDQIAVTAAEVDAYYRDHRSDFERLPTAFMSYLSVSHRLDASDSAAARAKAERLRQEIGEGAPFTEIAIRESDDPGSAQSGGDLGTFGRGVMYEEFEAAVFSLPLNRISEPVRTPAGYHLIEVTARTADSVTARHILSEFTLAGAHRDLVDAQVDSLERHAADRLDGAALDTAARILKLPVGQTAPVQKGSRAIVGDFMMGDPGVWAFQAKVGETSPVIDDQLAEAYYVFRLDSLQKGGVPPLSEIRPSVEAAVREKKKEEMALELARTLAQRVRAGENMADVSAELGLVHREFPAFTRVNPPLPNPSIIGTSFGLPVGGVSDPVVTPEGIYVIKAIARTPADSTAFRQNIDMIRATEVRAVRDNRVRYFLSALRDAAKVKDDRAGLFRTQAQADAEIAPLAGIGGF